VRIAFPNLIKIANHLPITDMPMKEVTGIRVLPSRFEKWFWKLFGVKAKGKFYVINRKSK
jgi:hypothetical protein